MRKHIFYNTVNFQPVTFRILFFRGIQTLQMRLSRKACFWWTQLLRPFCRAADEFGPFEIQTVWQEQLKVHNGENSRVMMVESLLMDAHVSDKVFVTWTEIHVFSAAVHKSTSSFIPQMCYRLQSYTLLMNILGAYFRSSYMPLVNAFQQFFY